MSGIVETAKQARAALKRAFPGQKFSVTSGSSIDIRWTDDGSSPTVEQVQDALLAAGCAKARTSWDNKRYLDSPGGGSFWFDRYNVAERAAEQQERERRHREYRAERQRVNQVIADARRAKCASIAPLPNQATPPITDPSIHTAFEALRQRAETEVAAHGTEGRRASWAPPLILGEDLALACLELDYLTNDDKLIGRLWATFATPKRSSRWLREHTSTLPLREAHCRGFERYAGATRPPRSALLFEAQRTESGEWRFGPQECFPSYRSERGSAYAWEQLIRDREQARLTYSQPEQTDALERRLAELDKQIAAIDADDHVKATAHRERQQLRQRALELARARILDFIGAPDAQMQLAARLWGHCCTCGKELTDPISLERGIGPDCLEHRTKTARSLAQDGHSPENIAVVIGMPVDFVTAVLREMQTV
jgi:conjugative element/phage-associated large polyvalent protein/uncharacterized protein DUF6011